LLVCEIIITFAHKRKRLTTKMSKRIIIIFVATATIMLLGCDGNSQKEASEVARQMINEAREQNDSQRLLALADSLGKTGDLSEGESSYWQAFAYYRLKQLRSAEFYWTESLKATENATDPDELATYARSASYQAGLYIRYLHFANALNLVKTALAKLDNAGYDDNSDYTNLLIFRGCCEAYFKAPDDVVNSFFERAYHRHLDNINATHSKDSYRDAVVGFINIAFGWISVKNYEQGLLWTERFGDLVKEYKELFADDENYIDKQLARYNIFSAIALESLGRMEEASAAYNSYTQSKFSKSFEGQLDASEYLLTAGYWNEAADNLMNLDRILANEQAGSSLEDIQKYLLMKYRANIMAGRRDTADVVANQICERLDSAIARSQWIDSQAIETIRQKEAQILQQQQRLARGRIIGLFSAMVALIIIFVVITILRHRAAKRLAEIRVAKERMESELRIARDIQMSMVPNHFPHYPGLDMFALMSTAKEVGGDLYGYVLNKDYLYFCVGDVSGKGVPASLFMSQTIRLFNMMAEYGLTPSQICTNINKALSGEDNVNSMFVTMIVCRLNLKQHVLEFCNAGHNPPVLGTTDGQFSFLEMKANAPVGLWPELEYEGEVIDSFKDRLLLLYTDGLNEAENAHQEQFGDERLLTILHDGEFDTPRDVIETISAKVEEHRNGTEPNDDLTMLCITVH